MINRLVIVGNLTRDAELKSIPSGASVLEFSIAVNKPIKKDGAYTTSPMYFDCKMWRGAERLAPHLTKGRKVCIDGALDYRAWERDGAKRSKVEILVNELEYMDRGENVQNNAHAQAVSDEGILADGDIPF